MKYKYTNIYYFHTICKIGGIETFFYQLAKRYKDIDLTIIYKEADKVQLRRLKKYVRCIRYTGQKIECEKAFFNFNTDIIDNVDAKEYCLVVHGDYKMLNGRPPEHKKIDKYYGVSKTAADSYTELTGKPCEVLYNPIDKEPYKPLIKLCSACRLDDPVKGATRTKELIKKLDEYSIKNNQNYIWYIFTNQINEVDSPNVVYMKPTLDITPYMVDANYVVQLSDDFEGYNYTINESLINKTPVVITPCKVYKELGIDDTMSIRLDFDLSNIDEVVEKIFSSKLSVEYKPPKDGWDKVLVNNKSTYQEELKMIYKVEALEFYKQREIEDNQLGRVPEPGEQWLVDKERLDILLGDNKYNVPFVKVVEEIKPEYKEDDNAKKVKVKAAKKK